jgi:hypothetical protein
VFAFAFACASINSSSNFLDTGREPRSVVTFLIGQVLRLCPDCLQVPQRCCLFFFGALGASGCVDITATAVVDIIWFVVVCVFVVCVFVVCLLDS